MHINVEDEIRHFISKCTPRIRGVLSDGYGIHILRENIANLNEYGKLLTNGESLSQWHYQSLYGFSMTIAEFEYAMGYPLDRVKYFLGISAEFMLGCVKLRGSNSAFEITTNIHQIGDKWTETVEDALSFVDDSLGNALKGFYAGLIAGLCGNTNLMHDLFSAITFKDYDYEVQGKENTIALRALVSFGLDDLADARMILSTISPESVMARIAYGIINRDSDLFEDGLKAVFRGAEEAGGSLLEDNKPYCIKKGLEPIPGKYWCIEGMGLILFARKNGLECDFQHEYTCDELSKK